MRRLLAALAFFATACAGEPTGDRCTKGCACGQACIDCSKNCTKNRVPVSPDSAHLSAAVPLPSDSTFRAQ